MGQLLFQYMFNPILETVNQFQYHWEKTTEYGLYYQRYAALSDASIFDAPVAITKVATGVSRIQELFPVDKIAHPATALCDLFVSYGEISKEVKDTIEDSLLPAQEKYQNQASVHIGQNGLRRTILPNKEAFDGMFTSNANEFRVYLQDLTDYTYWFPDANYLSMIPQIFVEDRTWKHLSRFSSNEWLKREWTLDRIPGAEHITLPRNWRDINLYDIIFMTPPDNILSLKDEVIAWTYGPIMDRYYTEVVERIHDNSLSEYQIQYGFNRTEAGYSVYPQEFMRLKFLNHLNFYKSFNAAPERRDVCFEFYQRFGKFVDKTVNWTENLSGEKNGPTISWHKDISGQKVLPFTHTYSRVLGGSVTNKDMNIMATGLHGSRHLYSGLWEQIYCDRQNDVGGNIFDFYGAHAQEGILSAFQTLLGKPNKRHADYQRYDHTGGKQAPDGVLDNTVHEAFRRQYKVQSQDYIPSGKRVIEDTSAVLNHGVWGIKTIQPVAELSLDDFTIRENKTVFTINGVTAVTSKRPIELYSYLTAYRSSRPAMEGQIQWSNLINKHMVLSPSVWTFKSSHDISLDDYFQLGAVSSWQGKIVWEENDISVYKDRFSFELLSQVWTSTPIKKSDIDFYGGLMADKTKKEMPFLKDAIEVFGQKDRRSIDLWVDELAVKSKKDFVIHDSATSAYKVKHDFIIDDSSTLIQKIRKDFIVSDTAQITHKESKEMYFEMVHLWFAYKVPKDFIIMPWDFLVDKVKKDFSIQDSSGLIYKDRKPIPDTDVVVSAIKSAFSFIVGSGFDHPKWEDVGGFIVPVSKVRKSMIENLVDHMASKVFKDTMISEGVFASVIPENTQDMFGGSLVAIDKYPHKVFMDYQNEGVIKSRIHTAIHDDYVIGGKIAHIGMLQDGVWTWKAHKILYIDPPFRMSVRVPDKPVIINPSNPPDSPEDSEFSGFNGLWLSKKHRHLNVFDIVFLDKKKLQASIFEQVNGSQKRISYTSIFADYWLEKLPNLCYYSYGEWLKKDHPYTIVHEDEGAFRKTGNAVITYGDPATRKHLKAWYDEYLVGDSIIRQGELATELEWLEKTRKKCGLHPNDFGNWAWVYETPDPFQDAFGIDELLLPENDTHYENFKELIFDSIHMRPRKPVKEISDTQWIAKYPIKHPTPKWADVAVDYDASAIDWENYYGIETSIMHDMFLRYYRIWNAKMFEFSTMTMQQSVNLMLEYMWAWIPEYFPVGKLEEAYRVFKLIRWFGEAAIINNSQYIISYEYDNGGMKMKEDPKTHKKTWGVYGLEVNLKDCSSISTNDTMFMDHKQYVIRNNPVYVGRGPAWVEFILKAKRNTTVSFTLMNTVGSVNIYVDDVLTDTRSKTGKVIIPIQYTGDEVTIRLEKDKNNNMNDQFMIGNLVVPEQDFKDLTIEFDPQLRAGNKPLNEIAQKLIAYAMLHDQRDVAWSEALKANLGVSEVYKRMTKYWEDHHAGKIKGKRLTIKQV